jgi:hypothetical protein
VCQLLRKCGDAVNLIVAHSPYPALGRDPSADGNGARSVADLHTVKIESLAVVTLDASVSSTVVKGFNETSNFDQLAIVP